MSTQLNAALKKSAMEKSKEMASAKRVAAELRKIGLPAWEASCTPHVTVQLDPDVLPSSPTLEDGDDTVSIHVAIGDDLRRAVMKIVGAACQISSGRGRRDQANEVKRALRINC